MAKVPVIITSLCPACAGEKTVLNKKCRNCKGTGLIHEELIQTGMPTAGGRQRVW